MSGGSIGGGGEGRMKVRVSERSVGGMRERGLLLMKPLQDYNYDEFEFIFMMWGWVG